MSGQEKAAFTPQDFLSNLEAFTNYYVALSFYNHMSDMQKAKENKGLKKFILEYKPHFVDSLRYLKELSGGFWHEMPDGEEPGEDIPPTAAMLKEYAGQFEEYKAFLKEKNPLLNPDSFITHWRRHYIEYMRGDISEGTKVRFYRIDKDGNRIPDEPSGGQVSPPVWKEMFSVHSSAPVYDIGETIARAEFVLEDGAKFPGADIVGGTKGRIELLPFWDHANNRPLTPQSVDLAASAGTGEFARMQEEAISIATSYNEEMATYFYAMDAYWITNAQGADDFVELDISDLLQYTGKKPVKSRGKYSTAYRPDQLKRAGMMAYRMGFSMVELERAIVRGKGERTHYKRLWDVSDMYMMSTLEGDTYIESMTYRPNELFRGLSFGSRRETALLMSKVLNLDYDKMVTARRLGRYYTWLWRDRAYSGNIGAPISCKKLLERAGIEVEKGKERYARRSLETALDRLEQEEIITQWILVDRDGHPADASLRISFNRWLEMKISVSPPDIILEHYAGKLAAPPQNNLADGASAAGFDLAAARAERKRRGCTLAMLSEETGIELSTLSRILAGKTKRPRAEHVKALKKWLGQGKGTAE